MIPAVFGTHVTASTRPLSIWVGQRDVTSLVLADSLEIEDAGASQGMLRATLNEQLADLAEVTDHAYARAFDETRATEMWRGFVKGRRPSVVPTWATTEISAVDHGGLLDADVPGPVTRPAESDRARIGYFWGLYASPYLSPDLSSVVQVSASLPAQTYDGTTLRAVLDAIASQASSSATWYLSQTGHLHYFSSETNAAPKNVTSDTPGAGEVAPTDLDIDYDSRSYANAVYVRGRTPSGSGWVYDHAEIARIGTKVTATLDAPDCSTTAMKTALGAMYLGRVAGVVRGSFTVWSHDADGWRAGQTLTVRSAAFGINATYRLSRVTTTQTAPGTFRYRCEFGASRRGTQGRESVGRVESAASVVGAIGGPDQSGVTVVDSAGVERVTLGAISATDYGLKVVSSDGSTTIIDGTSNMFKIAATGTITVGPVSAGSSSGTSVTLTALGNGFTATPVMIALVGQTNSASASRWDFWVEKFVAASSGGAVTTPAYVSSSAAEAYISIVAGQVEVNLTVLNANSSPITKTLRYYVLEETGI